MARNKSNRAWLREHVTDWYVREAQREGYRSRAAYKLAELARRDRLIRPGMLVVDLGCVPGGWSQVASRLAGPQGQVVAVDIQRMEPLAGVVFIQGDVREQATLDRIDVVLRRRAIDLVVSDMAPNISGVVATDAARAGELAETVLEFAVGRLKPAGALLVKAFHGVAADELRRKLERHFSRVSTRKPAASRSRSSEIYLLARGVAKAQSGVEAAPMPNGSGEEVDRATR